MSFISNNLQESKNRFFSIFKMLVATELNVHTNKGETNV
jgi:hypothetical protein